MISLIRALIASADPPPSTMVDLSLSDTIKLYEKGQLLVQQCNKALEQAQLIITNYDKI